MPFGNAAEPVVATVVDDAAGTGAAGTAAVDAGFGSVIVTGGRLVTSGRTIAAVVVVGRRAHEG